MAVNQNWTRYEVEIGWEEVSSSEVFNNSIIFKLLGEALTTTKIDVDAISYNLRIDSNTPVTVTLLDFNGAAVIGKSVTLTCDKGYFNNETTKKSVTSTTNSSGQITATWTASEWGLCTFSANNIKIQTQVTGWKTIPNTATGITVKRNESHVKVIVNKTSVALTQWQKINIATIPSIYSPEYIQYSHFHTNVAKGVLSINSNGEIGAYTEAASGNANLYVEMDYPLK